MQVKIRPTPSKPPAARSGCARPGPQALQRLAASASDYSDRSPLAALNASAHAEAPVQRKMHIKGKPVEQMAPKRWRLQGASEDMPVKDNAEYADEWNRSFADMDQYRRYSDKSAPVSVGLIEPYAAWYNIPHIEAGEFFVLGENHGAFGYRDLAQQSNITGNVLGEAGNHPLLDTPDALARNEGEGALKAEGVSREYMMESIASKTYYSANVVVMRLEKEAGTAKTSTSDGISRKTEGREDWIANYTLALPAQRGFDPVRLRPYYSVLAPKETRYFMEADTVAGPYSVYETAVKKLSSFQKSLKLFISANPDHDEIRGFRNLDAAIGTVCTELKKDKKDRDAKALLRTARGVRSGLASVSVMEDRKLMAAEGSAVPTAHEDAFEQVKDTAGHDAKANFYRERAMFQAIRKAKEAGFAFSGIGDNHAENLKVSVEKEAKVPVITLRELIADFSKPAL